MTTGVRVVFLGRLQDLAGAESMVFPAPLDWPGLLAAVPGPLREELRTDRVRVACSGRLMEKTQLAARDGDEVALLPPVSGG